VSGLLKILSNFKCSWLQFISLSGKEVESGEYVAMGIDRQHYQTLQQKVDRLKEGVDRRSMDLTLTLADVQQQAGITRAEAIDPKTQSYQTEIDKQLRLLAMDLMMLKTAKQPATIEQRWAGIGDRVGRLQGYCAALLAEDSAD
jgi:hypothetical protein